jgi:radical S-adenosyl methionine domain-containing protein 2
MLQSHESTRREARSPIVINWHVTEACNYHCGYCYAKWQRMDPQDLIRDPAATTALLQSLHAYFASAESGSRPRLNFAGGEPLLHGSRLISAMRLARSIGFDVSIITNGSRLKERVVASLAPELSLLGLSIDAVAPAVLAAIGRQDRQARRLDLGILARHVAQARRINPALTLKINTVVCAANWHEDLSAVISELAPARWKVLRMLPVVNRDLEVSDMRFRAFVDRHSSLEDVMSVEDSDDMVGSYVMVDPSGRFFQNRLCAPGYDYSPPILDVGAADAFARVGWSALKFDGRYARTVSVVQA